MTNKIFLLINFTLFYFIFSSYSFAAESVDLNFKGLKPVYTFEETASMQLEAKLGSTLKTPVDLWIAVLLPMQNRIFFFANHPNTSLAETPQPFKQNIQLTDSVDSIIQIDFDKSLAGKYTFYALYADTNTDFEQLLTASRSNLAITQITVTATTGLETRPINNTCVGLSSPTSLKPFAQKLSDTGCMESNNPVQAIQSAIPYSVNSPLWTDGATKQRWIAIPNNTQIKIRKDGRWIFPTGSVLIKNFYLDNQSIETRLLVHHTNGNWAGYSYEWNDEGTQAFLLDDVKLKDIKGQTWVYPSPAQCLECHNEPSHFALGTQTIQMNRLHSYTQQASQMGTLFHTGVLEHNKLAMQQPVMPEPSDSSVSIEQRARAYLHANCAHCHRPENNPATPHNYLFNASLADLCREVEYYDSSNVAKKYLLVAGYPEYSLIYLRMNRRDELSMPPLGTTVLDLEGLALIEQWIRSMENCDN